MKYKEWLNKVQHIDIERYKTMDSALQDYLKEQFDEYNRKQQIAQTKKSKYSKLSADVKRQLTRRKNAELEREDAYELLESIGVPFCDGEPIGVPSY